MINIKYTMQSKSDYKTRIQKYSRCIWFVYRAQTWLCLVGLGCVSISVLGMGALYLFGKLAQHPVAVSMLWKAGLYIPYLIAEVFFFKNLTYFFGRLTEGFLFDAEAANRLLAVGKWYIVSWVAELVLQISIYAFPVPFPTPQPIHHDLRLNVIIVLGVFRFVSGLTV